MQDDGVSDGVDGAGVVLAAGVAVGAAALAGPGCGPWRPCGDQVVLVDELGGQVREGAGQCAGGERAALVTESRAASKARLKLTRPGSRPAGAA